MVIQHNVIDDNLSGMLLDCEGDIAEEDYDIFQDLFDDSEKRLPIRVFNDMFPESSEMHVSTYKAKKLLCPMAMDIERMQACPNDCMLYRNEYSNLHVCITCGTSRYNSKNPTEENNNTSKNGPHTKVLWYLPIIPILKRLFANPKDAKLMR
ncbi:hypothetical protein LXL04_023684 [Taraxacum kok-saghyz]